MDWQVGSMGAWGIRKLFGPIMVGVLIWLFVLSAWGFSLAIFSRLPNYDKVMQSGEVVAGEVIRVEKIENITVNGKNPHRLVYRYGSAEEGSMRMAFDERKPAEGEPLKIRVLGENTYPEGIRPLARPAWLSFALLGGFVLGALVVGLGALRLLLLGGLLVAARHARGKASTPPSGSPPPPPPPTRG